MNRPARLLLILATSVAFAACSANGTPASSGGGAGGGGTAASGSGCQPTQQAGGAAVTIRNFQFQPQSITARVGQPITWTNQDSAQHGAILDSDSSCSTGPLSTNQSGSLVFSKPGTYTYHCVVHGNTMTGTITITG